MFYSLKVLDCLVSMEKNKMGVTQYCDGNADSASTGMSEYFILTFLSGRT